MLTANTIPQLPELRGSDGKWQLTVGWIQRRFRWLQASHGPCGSSTCRQYCSTAGAQRACCHGPVEIRLARMPSHVQARGSDRAACSDLIICIYITYFGFRELQEAGSFIRQRL